MKENITLEGMVGITEERNAWQQAIENGSTFAPSDPVVIYEQNPGIYSYGEILTQATDILQSTPIGSDK